MEFTFENQGNNTYLVYKVESEDSIDTLSLGMLTNNRIAGLASTLYTQMDADKYLKYNISAHISVQQFFDGVVNKKRLIGVFKGIVNALIAAEDYMLDARSLLLDLNYMYTDVSTCDTVLICLPVVNKMQEETDYGMFFKNIVFGTQFDQTENCDYVAGIINYLNTPRFSPEEFLKVLEGIEGGAPAQQAAPQAAPVRHYSAPQPAAPAPQPAAPAPQPAPQHAAPAPQPAASQGGVATMSRPAAPAPQPAAATPAPAKNVPPKAPAQPPKNTPPRPPVGGMAVPGKKPAASAQPAAKSEAPEKMSFFYLMQHYNKENAELYKQQKAAKKGGSPSASQAPQPAPQPNMPPQRPAPAPQPAPQSAATAPQPAAPAPQPAPQPAFVPREVPQGQGMNFGETTVLGGGSIGETTVLSASSNPMQTAQPFLLRLKNNERITLNKPVFRIGKERSYVDYFIGDNTAISRSHANLISRNGEFYVVDTNSTNHTYLNGAMIQSNEEKKLAHGDKLRLANEEFEFRLY